MSDDSRGDARIVSRYSRATLRSALSASSVPAVPEPRTGPHLDGLWAELRAEAGRGADTTPPSWSQFHRFEAEGDRVPYERVYFARRGRLNALAATARLDGGAATTEALADMIWSVCDEYTWAVPAHTYLLASNGRPTEQCVDLFAAETAHALAEIVTLLGDRLPASVADRARTEVRSRVLDPFFDSEQPWLWESSTNNWSAVCSASIGMAALALLDDLDELAEAMERCLGVLEVYLSGFDADGGCAEGIAYWVYGFGYFTYFAEALRERTGLDLLRDTPKAAAIASFPQQIALGGGEYVMFSDTTRTPPVPTGLVSRLRERLGTPPPAAARVPSFRADWCHRWAHLARTLAWTDPAALGAPADEGAAWLPDLAWLLDRRVIDGRQVVFAAKGGHNDEPHNHNDLGHFTVSVDGEELLADLGAGSYSHGYFGPDRYAGHLHPSALAHSVPVVDGLVQQPGRGAAATVVTAHVADDGAELSLDLSAAYEGRPVLRSFIWRSDGVLGIADTFGDAQHVEEVFISRIEPRLGDSAVIWSGTHATAVLTYDSASWQPLTERLDTVGHLGEPDRVYRLRLRSRGTPAADFVLAVRPFARLSRA
ncbi:heparinase II/III family protein [Streptomyces sp. NPDC007861]|uniref:heparinase II/III family protein n=1 Tax=Streptomyces sp. NPDC007861 TaxID=3154893 RepID=UPI0033EC08A4